VLAGAGGARPAFPAPGRAASSVKAPANVLAGEAGYA